MRRIIPAIIFLVAILAFVFQKACPSKVYYTYETASPVFTMRWETRDDLLKNDGYSVVFLSAQAGSTKWQEITSSWTDEPQATPGDDRMRFIDARIGYLFYMEKYAVTTDGGQSWTVWDAERKMRSNSCFINGVTIDQAGQGLMNLECTNNFEYVPHPLKTTDFGRSWQ